MLQGRELSEGSHDSAEVQRHCRHAALLMKHQRRQIGVSRVVFEEAFCWINGLDIVSAMQCVVFFDIIRLGLR